MLLLPSLDNSLAFRKQNIPTAKKIMTKNSKKMMQWSQKMYGAPISIASSTMKISHKELVSLLLVSFATYKDKN